LSRTFSSRPPNTTLAAQDLSVHSTSLVDTNTYCLALTPREGEEGQHTPPHIRGPPHIWGGDNGVQRMRTGIGDSNVWGKRVDGRGFATPSPTGGHTHRLMHSLQSPQAVTVLTNTRSSRLSSFPLSLSLASPPSGLCLALSHSTPTPPPNLNLFSPSFPLSLFPSETHWHLLFSAPLQLLNLTLVQFATLFIHSFRCISLLSFATRRKKGPSYPPPDVPYSCPPTLLFLPPGTRIRTPSARTGAEVSGT